MRKILYFFTSFILATCTIAKDINIKDFGAKGDGKNFDQEIIQKAIDECSASGGGEVFFPKGIYIANKIFLKNDVTINLDSKAVIKMTPALDKKNLGLLVADGVNNVGLKGNGTLDGSGELFNQKDHAQNRPYVFYAKDSKNVRIENVSMINSAFWTLRLFRSDGVWIRGINIFSHSNFNNDGIDIDAKNVVISDCIIDSDDDGLCLKSDDENFLVENVVITNCVVASNCNPIKFGTANRCGFKNVTISNCVIRPCAISKYRFWNTSNWMKKYGVNKNITGIAGIAIEAVDGGFAENISISNISMVDIHTPLFIRVGKRNKSDKKSYAKNIIINAINATAQSWISSSITGLKDQRVENVSVSNCIFNILGGEPQDYAKLDVPEVEGDYPENRMFKSALPSHGMFIRHANNITLNNVQFLPHTAIPTRPAIVAEDVALLRLIDCLWLSEPILKECTDTKKRGNTIINY